MNLKLTILLLLPAAFMLVLGACGGDTQPTPDIDATVEATVEQAKVRSLHKDIAALKE
jgi:hypothetical protein